MRPRHAVLSVAVALVAMAPPAATAAPAPTAMERMPEFGSIVDAYQRDYPGISRATAVAAANAQEGLTAVVDAAGRTAEFGGAWFDPRTTTLHVYATTKQAGDDAVRLGAGHALRVAVHRTNRGFRALESLARAINAKRTPAEVAEGTVAKAESRWNRVTVVTPAAHAAAQRAKFAHDARVGVTAMTKHPRRDLCTDRGSCGSPARSGTIIGYDYDGPGPSWGDYNCSLGFTAAASDGSKWIVTAGHCAQDMNNPSQDLIATSCPSSACWGHGAQYFGPMRQVSPWRTSYVDVGRIRKDNAYWGTGGYMYNATTPNSPVDVDGAITSFSSVTVGANVCQSMWHAVSGASCGTVVDDVSWMGRVEASIDACGGDSGGGWYHLSGSSRIAWGIHSASDNTGGETCHSVVDHSYFTSIPDINNYWDANSAATIRVETR